MSAHGSAGGSAPGADQSEEIAGLRDNVSMLTQQVSQLALLISGMARKKEESSAAEVGDADRASEDIAAASAGRVGTPQAGSAQDGTYLREPFGESGPEGRHSGEAGGYVPQEVRVAAAHQGGFSNTTGGGVAAGYAGGFGVPAMGAGYQSVKYSSPPFDGKAKNFKSWLQDFCLVANGANLLDHLQEGAVEIPVNSGQSKHSLCQRYSGYK